MRLRPRTWVTPVYVNICGAVKSLAGLLQCNGGKVKETEGQLYARS